MARTDTLGNFLTDVAAAIRTKKGITDTIPANTFDTEIASIEGGSSKYAPRRISFKEYTGTELDYELENLDTSNLTTFKEMFYTCAKLLSVPVIDTSKGTDFSYMFYACRNITKIPEINTSEGTNFSYMFNLCDKVTSFPLIDTSKGTDLSNMFLNCSAVTEVPALDTSFATNVSYMFSGCKVLTSIPSLSLGNAKNMMVMFSNCNKLETLSEIDSSSATNITNMFFNCYALVEFGGLKNLGQAYLTTASANYGQYKLNLSLCSKLTEQSLINVLNNLYDIATKGCNTQQVVLGSTNLAKLTSEEGQAALTNATTKGWTVS